MHWNLSIGPEILPIFDRFLTLFPLKRPARREQNTSNMAATIGDVMDDITCKMVVRILQKTLSSSLVISDGISFLSYFKTHCA
jgi:hypothetical protein